jgi:iron complex transport system substrate-binding protein
VGPYVNVNVEKIIGLSPDLVIGTRDGNSAADVKLLEQAGIPVFIVNPRSVESVISTVALIGKVCGISEKAAHAADELTRRFESVRAATEYRKRPLVFLQINCVPIMAVNKTTVHDDLIRLAGGVNMTADEPVTYPRISREEVIRREPDVIIISSMERGGRFEKAKQDWMQWTSIPAVKNNRVHLIDSDLIDRPSPRIIDGLEAMARIIHPEVAWENRSSSETGQHHTED